MRKDFSKDHKEIIKIEYRLRMKAGIHNAIEKMLNTKRGNVLVSSFYVEFDMHKLRFS